MCTLAAGGDFSSGCPVTAPGVRSGDIWLINRSEVTFTGESSSNHLFTSFTMSGSAVVYRYEMHNTGNSVTEEFQANDNGGGSFFPSVNLRALSTSNLSSKAITDLVGSDVVAVVRTKADKFLVLGSGGGLTLVSNRYTTETDNLGESFSLAPAANGDGEPTKHKYLLDTDVATTQALLEAAE